MTLHGERKYGVKCINYVSPAKLVICSRTLSSEMYVDGKIGKYLFSEWLMVNIGLRQGHDIARLLFTTLLDTALEKSTSRNKLNHV
jgi:hypothetical protein